MALVVRNLQIDLTVRNGLTVFSMLLRIIFEAACDLTHMPHERAELKQPSSLPTEGCENARREVFSSAGNAQEPHSSG